MCVRACVRACGRAGVRASVRYGYIVSSFKSKILIIFWPDAQKMTSGFARLYEINGSTPPA